MLMLSKKQVGFTIVELLIVIVVIGILAAITIVAYNGVQNRANDTVIQSDLHNFGNILAQQKAVNGTYPTVLTADMGIKFSKSAYGQDSQTDNARYCINTTTDQYIIVANSKAGKYFKYTSDKGLEPSGVIIGWSICEQVGLTQINPQQNGLSGTTWAAWAS